LAFVRSINS